MDGYFINLDSGNLKIGIFNGQETPKFISEELLPTAASQSKILDPVEFAKEFSKMLALHLGNSLPKLPLYFILEPEVTELFLITTQKNGVGDDEYINTQIKERLVDEKIEDIYYTYFKIAPFIYQFNGIKKVNIEPFLEAANALGLELGGIFPLGLLLAKYNNDISSMFVFPSSGANTVVFSELTGVTFAEKFEGDISISELKELFWKLSVYNSSKGNLNIYTYSKYSQVLSAQGVSSLTNGALEKDFETVSLSAFILNSHPIVIDSHNNLLNVLPLPQRAESRKVPALVMASIVSFILIGGLVLQLTVGFNNIFGSSSGSTSNGQQVLSNNDQTPPQQSPTPTPAPQQEVKRSDLKIRVENGNGVAGSAGKLKAYLEGFGYTVVGAYNADKDNYASTTIKLPKEMIAYKDLLTNDLKTNYSVELIEIDGKPTGYDIVVIAGQK